MKIKDRFLQAIKTSQRKFSHDRSKTLGASSTFACIRRAWFDKHAAHLAQPHNSWGMMERGNLIENSFAVPKLKLIFGEENCLYIGDDQQTFIHEESSATPDSLIINQPLDCLADDGLPSTGVPAFMCEIKSFDPRMNLKEEKAIHAGQAIMQIGQVRHNTQYKPVYSMLLYINASDLADIRPFFIKYDDEVYNAGKARGLKVFATQDVTKLFPEGKHTDQCRVCPYTKDCNAADIKVFPSHVSKYTDNEVKLMRSLAKDYETAAVAVKEAEAKKAEISNTIKTTLVDMNSKGIEADDFRITYSKMAGKESLDKDALALALAKHGMKLDDFVKHGDEFTRLTVTIR